MFIYNTSRVHSSLIQSVKEIVANYFFTLRMYFYLLTQLGRRSKSKKFPHQFRQSFPWGMNMNLWIFNLVCSAVYGINRISEPDLKAVSFAEKIAGQKLNGSLRKEQMWIRKVTVSFSVWMKSDVSLTTLEPKRATQGNSNVS